MKEPHTFVKSSDYENYKNGGLPEIPDVDSDEFYTHVKGDEKEFFEKAENFVTKDLYLAAAILATKSGVLEEIDRNDRRHMKFYFSGVGLGEIESSWTNRTLTVNASDFSDSIRKMKSEIHRDD